MTLKVITKLKSGSSAWYNLALEAVCLKNEKRSGAVGRLQHVQLPKLALDEDQKQAPSFPSLHAAAWIGDVSTMEALREDPDLNVAETTQGGFTALHFAASRGHTEAVRALLEWSTAEVNAVTVEGFTALHMAAYGGHLSCVRLLLQQDSTNAHINARDKVLGRTALHWAVGHNSDDGLAMVNLMLQSSEINPCPRDRAGFTPLHFAVINSGEGAIPHAAMEAIVLCLFHRPQQLRKIPANVIRQMMWGIPEKMVEVLLTKYPDQIDFKVGNTFPSREDVEDFNSMPWRPLWTVDLKEVHAAAPSRRFVTGFPKFRALGKCVSGFTALHFASGQNHAELVSYLLENFPDMEVNEPDLRYGMTPLHRTMLKGAMRSFKRLMSCEKVDVNALVKFSGQVDPQPWLPQSPVLERIDENGSDAYKEFRPGEFCRFETPLHLGIRFCAPEQFLKMITTFLKHPALDVTIRNTSGTPAIQLAWLRSDCTLVSLPSHPVMLPIYFLLWPHPPLAPMSISENSSETCITLRATKRYKAIDSAKQQIKDLDIALDMLEEHPGNERLMKKVNDALSATQQSVNAVLVTASVIAGFQFLAPATSLLQVDKSALVWPRLFWTCYNLSFFFAIFTAFRCLGTTAIARPMAHRQVGNLESLLAYEQTRYTGPLHLCVMFGVVAFVSSAANNIPRQVRDVAWSCCPVGFFLVLVEFARNLTGSYEAYLHGRVQHRIQRGVILHIPCYVAREIIGLLLAPLTGLLTGISYYRHVSTVGWTRKYFQIVGKSLDQAFLGVIAYLMIWLLVNTVVRIFLPLD
ncbi:hypothetical protein MPTK1_5g19380 [Marchantia polymorpha subsp. ruderalis]|uniref:PGG domain-containing protein n=2 Tax=Marchantia polymorpha TaxID=3197 RepID=A0AAF6BK17_MARPO|nr:hypothetical protein MARPO_0073s0006 [Marchantia polymorpha]BBN12351.1 hypothetical protein Mp_5g19380 [Marchantia polymorpha subsp. ruderalis]|eukprot:PTQ35126.1 hypothetical protein MARPO_0073s0006 [Marchantia polymorpha]